MPFVIETAGEVLVVGVVGQLVVGNRQEFKQAVVDEVERGARRVLIDFTDTGYVDSSGLGALVSLNKRLRDVGGELRLTALNEDMRTLFELTRLDTLFKLYATRDEALAQF
ncbi:MAG: STAS domain-containing protein [Phycisphaerae bacterium]|nr:STAS domain-containing protein [Gemmatimonadaceae bacterium]